MNISAKSEDALGKSLEKVTLAAILAKTPCPECKEKTMQMTGLCFYTSPGMWKVKCPCGMEGTIGYVDLRKKIVNITVDEVT